VAELLADVAEQLLHGDVRRGAVGRRVHVDHARHVDVPVVLRADTVHAALDVHTDPRGVHELVTGDDRLLGNVLAEFGDDLGGRGVATPGNGRVQLREAVVDGELQESAPEVVEEVVKLVGRRAEGEIHFEPLVQSGGCYSYMGYSSIDNNIKNFICQYHSELSEYVVTIIID
jgi:hypothetical protein